MRYQKFILGILIISLISGCASVHGYTRNDKRDNILSMQSEVLEQLYEVKPFPVDSSYEPEDRGSFSPSRHRPEYSPHSPSRTGRGLAPAGLRRMEQYQDIPGNSG